MTRGRKPRAAILVPLVFYVTPEEKATIQAAAGTLSMSKFCLDTMMAVSHGKKLVTITRAGVPPIVLEDDAKIFEKESNRPTPTDLKPLPFPGPPLPPPEDPPNKVPQLPGPPLPPPEPKPATPVELESVTVAPITVFTPATSLFDVSPIDNETEVLYSYKNKGGA